MRTENDLRLALAEQPEPAPSVVDALVRRSLAAASGEVAATADRSVWRRQSRPILAAAAVLALTVTPVALIRSEQGSHHAPRSTAGAPGVVSGPVAPSSATSAVPSSQPTNTGTVMTPQALAQTLIDLLPGSKKINKITGRSFDGFVAAEVFYDDGHGAAELAIAMQYPPVVSSPHDAQPGPTTCDPKQTDGICSVRPDGSVVSAYRGVEYPDGRATTKDWLASDSRRDGVWITLNEWNSAQEKDAPISRPLPPLTLTQLTSIVSSPRWTTTVSSEFASRTATLFTPEKMK